MVFFLSGRCHVTSSLSHPSSGMDCGRDPPGQMAARLMHLHFCAFELVQLLPYGGLRGREKDETWSA